MFGEQKLQASDTDGGLQQFRLALSGSAGRHARSIVHGRDRAPSAQSVSARPAPTPRSTSPHQGLNLWPKSSGKRLVALAQFYLAIENAGDATRIAEAAVQLAPDLAAAHQALGAARHISFAFGRIRI